MKLTNKNDHRGGLAGLFKSMRQSSINPFSICINSIWAQLNVVNFNLLSETANKWIGIYLFISKPLLERHVHKKVIIELEYTKKRWHKRLPIHRWSATLAQRISQVAKENIKKCWACPCAIEKATIEVNHWDKSTYGKYAKIALL